jgi:hypothetical protein
MRRVVVHIDSVVLKGFQHADGHAVAQGLQQELLRLISQPAVAQRLEQLGSIPSVRAGGFVVAHAAHPAQMGADAATQIGAGLGL